MRFTLTATIVILALSTAGMAQAADQATRPKTDYERVMDAANASTSDAAVQPGNDTTTAPVTTTTRTTTGPLPVGGGAVTPLGSVATVGVGVGNGVGTGVYGTPYGAMGGAYGTQQYGGATPGYGGYTGPGTVQTTTTNGR